MWKKSQINVNKINPNYKLINDIINLNASSSKINRNQINRNNNIKQMNNENYKLINQYLCRGINNNIQNSIISDYMKSNVNNNFIKSTINQFCNFLTNNGFTIVENKRENTFEEERSQIEDKKISFENYLDYKNTSELEGSKKKNSTNF